MKRKYAIIIQFFFLLFLFTNLSWAQSGKISREFYQLTIYHYTSEDQEKVINRYLQQALLPALHRMGIAKIGVFKNLANDTSISKSIYVLVPGKSLENLNKQIANLNADKAYQSAGSEYINAGYNNPPYVHIERNYLRAFSMAPTIQMPVLKAEKKRKGI